MKVLVLNCGSSSVKYQLIEMEGEQVICNGIVERIGAEDAIVRYSPTEGQDKRDVRPVADHAVAIDTILSLLVDPQIGMLDDLDEIAAV
ncbi:MAG: acetate kinase, partial [Anaerolineae bacterium]|nr:acetate kinase [Anaerolineae bacterium]